MHRLLNALVLVVVFAVGCQACASLAMPEPEVVTTAYPYRIGVVMGEARAKLAALWTLDPTQVERVYCVPEYNRTVVQSPIGRGTVGVDTVYWVNRVVDIEVLEATPVSVRGNGCPNEDPLVHVHTPTTCSDARDVSTCVVGGPYAYLCFPSRIDYHVLVARGAAFSIIQCGANEFVFYFPADYQPNRITLRGTYGQKAEAQEEVEKPNTQTGVAQGVW